METSDSAVSKTMVNYIRRVDRTYRSILVVRYCGSLFFILTLVLSACTSLSPSGQTPEASKTQEETLYTFTPAPSTTQENTPTNTATVVPSSSATSTAASTPAPDDWPGAIAFLGVENPPTGLTPTNLDLFVKLSDGNVIQVTQNAAVNGFSWSPNGDRIVFSASIEFSSYDLFIFDLADNTVTKLNLALEFDAAEIEPEWSPDGQQIAFVQFLAGVSTIYTYNVIDQSLQLLVEGSVPSWGPLGDSLLFVKRDSGSYFGQLAQYDFNNGQATDLLSGIFVDKARWSDDGKYLTFVGHSEGLEAGVYVTIVDEANNVFLSKSIYPPTWIPEQDEVLFAKPVPGMPNKTALVIFNLAENTTQNTDWIPDSFYVYLAILQPH